MKLPDIINRISPAQKTVVEFKGLNRNSTIEDGEMREMHNLSSDEYPCLYQRQRRGIYDATHIDPHTMITKKDKLAIIDGTSFYYDGSLISEVVLSEARPKRMAAINNWIAIFPDKVCYNISTGDVKGIAASYEAGETIAIAIYNDTLTICTITATDTTPFEDFAVGDAVRISGAKNGESDMKTIETVIKAINNDSTVITIPADSFTEILGTAATTLNQTGGLKVERLAPDLDHIMESNNRLWGCKGSYIYASKQGDPFNWNYFQALAGDSYAVSVGSDGDFTGCCAYSAHLLFFKEGCIHKLYGNKPSNYQIVDANCHGLEAGSDKSVAIINDTVFYKSAVGIMAYAGGSPELISSQFGTKDKYTNAVAGHDNDKYYVSMMNSEGKWNLFVFDLAKVLWHREDDTHALQFSLSAGKLYYIDADTNKIMTIKGIEEVEEIEWSCELGEFDEYIEQKKIYSRIMMRLDMDTGSEIKISVKTDDNEWEMKASMYAETRRAVQMPIIPERCNKFRLKIEGKGYCKIASMVREYREGSII